MVRKFEEEMGAKKKGLQEIIEEKKEKISPKKECVCEGVEKWRREWI